MNARLKRRAMNARIESRAMIVRRKSRRVTGEMNGSPIVLRKGRDQ
ncbi:hypothetical protein [Roseobacter ponti]|uniref:Uncharacterized protein n=1 Tax=Roseobacter ponti TaxID=1891787 RepID=A0A858SZI9_9RHOB|nr:hypothetical protein [Roseobacter ponti]QJF53302.1 hypothetical protein G3256_18615 [Roseobacter ponti]